MKVTYYWHKYLPDFSKGSKNFVCFFAGIHLNPSEALLLAHLRHFPQDSGAPCKESTYLELLSLCTTKKIIKNESSC